MEKKCVSIITSKSVLIFRKFQTTYSQQLKSNNLFLIFKLNNQQYGAAQSKIYTKVFYKAKKQAHTNEKTRITITKKEMLHRSLSWNLGPLS